METLWQDLRYGLRMLVRNPGFTLVATITLALGIGANTAMFSVVNAVLLKPLPYHEADRLAVLWTDDPKRGQHEQVTSFTTFNDWHSQSRSFADMAIFSGNPLVLAGEEPERVKGEFVTANLFPLLGVKPVLGQVFTQQDELHRERVVVLSHELWRRRFGSSPEAIGKTLTIDGDANSMKQGPRTVRVIGVMPAGFAFPDKETQLWEPATVYWRWERESTDRFHLRWGVIGRLRPNTTWRQAQAEMNAIGARLSQTYPAPFDFPGFGVNVVPLLDQITGKKLQLSLLVLLGAVGFVMLIACVNVANLLLARGAAREREFAIRTALGAGRARLMRQQLTECALLTSGAGLIGLLMAAWGIEAFGAFSASHIPRLDEVSIDRSVLIFTSSVSLLAGLLFGLGPAWKMSHGNPNEALKDGGKPTGTFSLRRTRGLLIVVECALAVVLLVGAGLLLRSFQRLNAVDPGFKPEGVLLVRVSLPPGARKMSAEQRFAQQENTFHQFRELITGLPGVQSTAVIGNFLIRGATAESITIEGRPPLQQGQVATQLASESVSPEFFRTMEVPLRRGRLFSRADAVKKVYLLFEGRNNRDNAVAAIINESFVRDFFPNEDPIGKRLYEGEPTGKQFWYEIVGVVGDMRHEVLEKQPIPELFVPHISNIADVVVRADSDPSALAGAVRQAIRSVEKNTMILELTTVESMFTDLSAERRLQTWLLALFAVMALALSGVGIYGIMHYAVVQRTHEIGVRIALGARSSDVLRLVIGQGMRQAAAGLAIGLFAAWGLTGLMGHLLFEVGAHDPATFVGVALVLASVAFLACWLPARRATKVDPMVALRSE